MARLLRYVLVSFAGLAVFVAARPAVAAPAKDGHPEVRAAGACVRGASAKLRLRSDGDRIEVRFEVEHRVGEVWRVVLVHERRVEWKGSVRTRRGGSVEVQRSLRDLPGSDEVTVRAVGPRGLVCSADATLPDS